MNALFKGPVVADVMPHEQVSDPSEMLERPIANLMNEKGFDGRGIIKIRPRRSQPDLAYQLFIQSLGDDANHTHLKLALSSVDTIPAQKFLAYLFNPKLKKTPIETLAKRCGIGIPQLRDIWRSARLDQGLLALLNEYPETMKDVARDARSTREACKFCGGTGQIVDEHQPPIIVRMGKRGEEPTTKPALTRCHSCDGEGWVRKAGDRDARQLMGEVLGVSGKKAPVFASTTNIFSVESVIAEIDQMQTRSNNAGKGIYDATATEVTDGDEQ